MNCIPLKSSNSRTLLFIGFVGLLFCLSACRPKPVVPDLIEAKTPAPQAIKLATDYCTNCSPCVCANTGKGDDYSNKIFTNVNFYSQGKDFTNANFSGATLIGCVFDNLDLTNANFSGATFQKDSFDEPTSFTNCTLTNTCFKKAEMSDVGFEFAQFKNTDFTCANISNADFGPVMQFVGDTTSRTKFNYAKISMSQVESVFPLNNFSPADWSKTDFSYTRFNGLSNDDFQPQGKDLSYAKLQGINFAFYDMRRCTLIGADLSYAMLNNVKLDSVIAYGANFNNSSLLHASMNGADFYNSIYKGTSFLSALMNGAYLDNANLQYALFSGANLSGAEVQYANLQYCNMEGKSKVGATTLNGANFWGSDFSHASLNDVYFQNNFLVETKFQSVDLSNTNFSNLVMSGVDFYKATLQDVEFIGSKLHNANFTACMFNQSTNGSGVNFSCADLGGANFENAVVNMANFSYAVIPPDTSCCLLKDSTYNCGTDSWTGLIYGHTTLPVLKVAVFCPDGISKAECSGAQWQIKGWQTNMCNTEGKNETVWTAPDCSGHHKDSTGIVIKDPSLKQCIADMLFDGDTTQVITPVLAETVTALSCVKRGILDISGLEYFPNLSTLDLTANQLTQDQFASLSPNLTTLNLEDNDLTSITLKSNQDNVTYLNVSNNQITSMDIASKYQTFLDLSYNQLAGDKTVFEEYEYLTYLDLSFNKLTSVGDMGRLTSLVILNLENNQLETIGNIGTLWDCGNNQLVQVNLENNDCFDCTTLDPDNSCGGSDIATLSHCACQTSCTNCTPAQ